jgi:hypothetical protein
VCEGNAADPAVLLRGNIQMLRLLATSIVAIVLTAPAARAEDSTRLVLKATTGTRAPHSVTLRCDPAGGTHPKAAQACSDLVQSHGEFSATRDRSPRACFMIYSPITVSAKGTWQGQSVNFGSKFPNACALHSKTGSIFDF